MIRILLNLMSFLAIVNLLALAIFIGWLWQSDRLDKDRILRARDLFSLTIAEEAQMQEQAAVESDQLIERQNMERRRVDPPVSSEDQLMQVSMTSQREQHTLQRLRNEKEILLAQLQHARDEIAERWDDFERERQAWIDATEEERQRRNDQQFAQTVRLYESLAPKQAKQMLVNLVQQGGEKQAVAYLNAMNPRAASRIVGQLRTDAESRLATDLLERLRTFGLTDQRSTGADDDTAARTPAFDGEPFDD